MRVRRMGGELAVLCDGGDLCKVIWIICLLLRFAGLGSMRSTDCGKADKNTTQQLITIAIP